VVAIGLQVAFSKSCIMLLARQSFLMSWRDIMFTFFSNLFKLMGT